jgi:hypothetical protein
MILGLALPHMGEVRFEICASIAFGSGAGEERIARNPKRGSLGLG